MHKKAMRFYELIVVILLGLLLAFISQFVYSTSHSATSTPLCTGPAEVGFQCPSQTVVTKKSGLPLAFKIVASQSGIAPDNPSINEVTNQTTSFNVTMFLLSSLCWCVLPFIGFSIYEYASRHQHDQNVGMYS
jgi:hypothetical protein